MKTDRLLGILNVLSRAEKTTAPELAEIFEVSRRTINRDIDDLCMAGIPIITKQGSGGGIYIQEGYKIDKSLLKSHEMSDIVTALKGLGSVSRNGEIKRLLNKISSFEDKSHDVITIDLSSFYKGSLSEKIERLKDAVNNSLIVEFVYYSKAGEFKRKVEPYQIIYRWSDWYMYGYCLYKNDFRMFKLNRLWDLTVTFEEFKKRAVPQEKLDFGSHLTDENQYEAYFDTSVKYLLIETYGPHCFTETEEGLLHFKSSYTNKDFIISWLLGFGDKVKVISPTALSEEIKKTAQEIANKYIS